MFPFHVITCFDIRIIHQRIQTTHPHSSRCHHCQQYCHYYTLDFACCSNNSHATLILTYHASMLTLQTSLISHALWLPAIRMIFGSFECTSCRLIRPVSREISEHNRSRKILVFPSPIGYMMMYISSSDFLY